MRPPSEQLALREVTERLADLLSLPPAEARSREVRSSAIDAIVEIGDLTFVIVWKGSSSLAQVSQAADQVRQNASELGERAAPLVAVPFMGPVGREHCRKARVNWLDLSGNAHIVAPGARRC